MKSYALIFSIALIGSFLPISQAFAWHCGQSCPSSILSGKLECEAYQASCSSGIIRSASSTSFSIKNNCDDVISATVEYIPVGSNDWKEESYTFSPYEKGLVAKTNNRNIYVSAKSHPSYSKKNIVFERQKVDTGSTVSDYTYSLNCNASTSSSSSTKFSWSQAGKISGMYCTRVYEDADPAPWGDNYLCSSNDIGMQWSQAGAISGMKCTRVYEDADSHAWGDNYLCVPPSSPINFSWSQAGAISGKKCTRVYEDADPDAWSDNYLCW